jgi:hypothetical protein
LRLAVAKINMRLDLKIKDQKNTLNLSAVQINDLKFRDRFTIESSTPLQL